MKRMSKKALKEFEILTEDYAKKENYSKTIKVIAGIASAASAVTLLTGCAETEGEYSVDLMVNSYHSNSVADNEIAFEKKLALYLCEKTGVNVEVFDIRDVNVVKSSGNYVVLSGLMINDVKEGQKECTITLEVNDELIEKLESSMERYYYNGQALKETSISAHEDIVSSKFAPNFLNELQNIINSENTKVSAIYDKEEKNWIYDEEEELRVNKR